MNKRFLSATAAAAALVLQAVGASADPGSATHVDSVSASVGNSIAVSGGATFVDIPVTVGQDTTGDASVAGIGADVTSLKISRPSAASQNIKFQMGIADQLPAPVSTAPAIVFDWPIGADEAPPTYYLEARRVSGSPFFPNASPNAQFMLVHNHPDGFHEHGVLTGTMANGVVEWTVSLSAIEASGATKLVQGSGCAALGSTAAAPGGFVLCNNAGGDGAFMEEEYEIPKAKVSLGIAPAGTPVESVAVSTPGAVNAGTGVFSGTLPKPATPGEYIVVAEACYGSSNCGRSSTTITV